MTREEAIRWLKEDIDENGDKYVCEYIEAVEMAIKALEREPILDKIRAEIMKLDDINPDYPMDRTIHISRNEVLQIVDKYRAESEINDKF
jgi:hypothetical protein